MTKKHIGLRFLCTYLLLVLPFLAISVLISTLTMGQMRRDSEAQLTSRLNLMLSGLEEQYTSWYEGGVYLTRMPELSPFAMQNSAVSARRGLEKLETVHVFDGMIDELLLWYDESHLYGSRGLARASVYLRVDMGLSGQAYETAHEVLSSPEQEAACLLRGEGEGYILLHYPMASGCSVNYCCTFSTVASLLQRLAGDEDILAALTLPGSEPLLFGKTGGAIRPLTRTAADALLDSGKWITVSGKTVQMDTVLELYMDEGQLFAGVERLQWGNWALLAMGMLLSGMLSVFLTGRRLTQLRHLEDALTGREAVPVRMGGFSGIHALIRDTVRENSAAMENTRSILRAQTARLLFHGLLKNETDPAQLLRHCGIDTEEEVFFITAVYAPGADAEALFADRLYCAAQIEGKPVCLFLDELPHPDAEGKLRQAKGEKLAGLLCAPEDRRALIVMSRPAEDLNAVDEAYRQALEEIARLLREGKTEGIFVLGESREMDDGKPKERENAEDPNAKVQEIMQYLQENYMREDISLEEMADHFGVSREHMSRLFRAETGMRYIDCLTDLRMRAAWDLICGTDRPIAEILHQVGYIDRSSSTKRFKQYFGITPSEARSRASSAGKRDAPSD